MALELKRGLPYIRLYIIVGATGVEETSKGVTQVIREGNQLWTLIECKKFNSS